MGGPGGPGRSGSIQKKGLQRTLRRMNCWREGRTYPDHPDLTLKIKGFLNNQTRTQPGPKPGPESDA
jgi:hypothetical protein